ncbi:MAG: hypothetical protein HRJ53_29535 [Acidobacteria bacterium Pan2503]|uniref:Fibronectin type-III domain-containing protein n=1 Tax=Candidatus Acidiferrum panamense TaxID=2741543 RepID=A0A7V8NXA2_9BACT|nr:hypothetical protein [Candidatus Acidoferrum panamensis]
MPVISALVFTKTDTTIAATWTTDVAADSNLSASGKAAIDNGFDGSVTSHSCIVAGLSPSTVYSCIVTSGGVSSTPQNVTTLSSPARTVARSASFGTVIVYGTGTGDTWFTFVSNDGNQYITNCDGLGMQATGTASNLGLSKITNLATMAGSVVNLLTNFGTSNSYSGTDGPGGIALTNKFGGCPFGLAGNLYLFLTRQNNNLNLPPMYNGGILMSADHGATWSNWQSPGGNLANGLVPSPIGSFEYGSGTFGWASPIRYAADDGTMGYNTAGNGIDGANAFVYQLLQPNSVNFTTFNLMRVPRKSVATLSNMNFQYWVGPVAPVVSDFVNDSNWSNTASGLTNIYSVPGGAGVIWPHITFIPGINSYVFIADDINYNWYLAAALTPAGPWTTFLKQQFANVGGPFFLHSDVIGNTLATGRLPLRMTVSSNGLGSTTYAPGILSAALGTTAMANTFVQGNGTSSAFVASPAAFAYGSNVTQGNLLVCSWRTGATAGVVSSITDTLGNAWNIVYNSSDTVASSGGWAYAFSKASGANTLTITFTGGTLVVCVGEWNGPNTFRTASAATNGGAGTSTPTSAAITAVAGDLLIAVEETGAGETTVTAGIGYVLRASGLAGASTFAALEDNLNALGGSTMASFTLSAATSWTAGIGAFYNVPSVPGGGDLGPSYDFKFRI